MYHNLRQQFWWTWMKRETTHFVSECDTCWKVKADYMKIRGLLQPLIIPEWKWDDISMDYIMGIPLTAHEFDFISVIMDRLSKSACIIPVNTYYNGRSYAEIYIARVSSLHGVPKMIISDQGSQFVACFQEQLHASLVTHLSHSLAYHPQTDGQTEQVNQILEDILRECIMEYQGRWDRNLPWAEFSYNNSYQESLKMVLFEVLYGHQCHTPLNWIEPGEKVIFGANLIDEAEVIVGHIQDNLKDTNSHQESYTNKRCQL
jgi:hypothetical protein